MSRKVHILKIYEEYSEEINAMRQKNLYHALLTMKYHNSYFKKIIDEINLKNNSSIGPQFFKGLSMPRLRILMALLAQKDGIICLNQSFIDRLNDYNIKKTPKRFQEKFKPLLVNGFYLLGTLIEDSLNEDACINCGNPFGFRNGDLGFWWAGVVILDWMKYFLRIKNANNSAMLKDFSDKADTSKNKSKKPKDGSEDTSSKSKTSNVHSRCTDFYNDPCLSRKYKYNQNSALSSLDRIPQQFLQEDDMKNFFSTIDKIDYNLERIVCSNLNPGSEQARLVCERICKQFGMTFEECVLKYNSEETVDE